MGRYSSVDWILSEWDERRTAFRDPIKAAAE